jgi:hypothetical protein
MKEQRQFQTLMFILSSVLAITIAGYALSACGSTSTTSSGGVAIAPQTTVQAQVKS